MNMFNLFTICLYNLYIKMYIFFFDILDSLYAEEILIQAINNYERKYIQIHSYSCPNK